MKKWTAILTMLLLLGSLFSCSPEASEAELFSCGIEVAETMKILLASDAYAELYGTTGTEDVKAFIASMDLSDLDKPAYVYAISAPDPEKMYEAYYGDGVAWDSMDDELQQQIAYRMGISSVITMMNARYAGQSAVVVASVYTATVAFDDLALEEQTTYLYVYESGIAVAVTFNEHGTAYGQFIFTDKPDEICDYFENFCEVERLHIK